MPLTEYHTDEFVTYTQTLREAKDQYTARKVQKGDIIIIICYAQMEVEKAKQFKPTLIFPNESTNQLN